MDHFVYQSGEAHCEGVALERIAQKVGTPVYVYSLATLRHHCDVITNAFSSHPTLPCFAVKANSNLSILREIFANGFGADVVSVGEMERALAAGAKASQIVFSGVGKTKKEIQRGIEVGILHFNVESLFELDLIGELAAGRKKPVDVCIRVNPNVDAKTNPYIATGLYSTKFGIAETDLPAVVEKISQLDNVRLVGLDCHIGSQITDLNPFKEAATRMVKLAMELKEQGHAIEHLDLGGGLGIRYKDENPPSMQDYANVLIEAVAPTGLKLIIEPGRSLVGNAGVLLTTVIGTKTTPKKNFIVVDAAMNDLLRPSLYRAYHDILPVKRQPDEKNVLADVVGPICETGDCFGNDRELPPMKAGDLVIVRTAGAYGATMAMNYNTRPKPPEVLVDGDDFKVIRRRENLASLWELEQ